MNTRLYGAYNWVGRHARLVTVVALLTVVALGVVGPMVVNNDEPNFSPDTELFQVEDRAANTLRSESTIDQATFIVEAPDDGDVLTADAFREFAAASERIRTSPELSGPLVDRYDPATGITIPGVLSIADLVADVVPGGLETATDTEIKTALADLLADGSPYADMAFTLSERGTTHLGPGGGVVIGAPAFTAQVVYDFESFDSYEASELWLRDVQAEFRAGAEHTDTLGIAIDGDTTFSEAAQQSAPFIFLAVALIILLIAVVHRSYWSAVLVATGLAATAIAYYGTAALFGLKMGSLLLSFIVPIAMISFGVDFYIHGVGRVREMQVEGLPSDRAYPAGMAAVFIALLLAVSSSIAAFLANAASGTEAIIQFGIGAAVALAWAYLLLGQLGPRVLLGLERFVGLSPVKGASRVFYAGTMMVVAILGGLTVALAAVMPAIGLAALGVLIVTVVGIPALLTRRRNRRAAAAGKTLQPALRGAAHGLRPAGALVGFLARWRVITLPVVLVIGLAGLMTATTVESGFEISDFLSSDTDFARSIERAGAHFPSSGEGSSFVFVEGDLTDPATLGVLDAAVGTIDAADVDLGRNPDGTLIVNTHAGDLVRMTMAAPSAVEAIETGGVNLVDIDGNGVPDTAVGVRAIYDYVTVYGVPAPDGRVAIPANEVGRILADDGLSAQATAIVVRVGSFTDGDVILPVEAALRDAAAEIEAAVPALQASVSGDVLTQFHGMEAFTRSMLVSLPLALVLAMVLAALMLRSIRYAIVSVIPILFVVTGVYAFMAVAGYTVNVVTATIAAIAVGVGIDFSTHFTARFREELETQPDRLAAARRAGEGTGGALVLSALTSVLGFAVMAMAPTPIFATFGVLTAVMIALALAAALLLLPSLLVLVTPKRARPSVEVEKELARV